MNTKNMWAIASLILLLEIPKSVAYEQYNFKMDWNPNSCSDGPCPQPTKVIDAFSVYTMLASNPSTMGQTSKPCAKKDLAIVSEIPVDVQKGLKCILANTEGNDADLWADIWTEGSCTGLSVAKYFTLMLNSYEKYNPNQMMYDLGLEPPYIDRDTFLAGVKKTLGVKGWVECDSKQKRFRTLVICLDGSGSHDAIDCPWSLTDPSTTNGPACKGDLFFSPPPKESRPISPDCSKYIPYTYKGPTNKNLQSPSPRPSPSPTIQMQTSSGGGGGGGGGVPIGAIVGGVIGGIAVIALIIGGVFLATKRHQKRTSEQALLHQMNTSGAPPPQQAPYVFVDDLSAGNRYATSPPVEDLHGSIQSSFVYATSPPGADQQLQGTISQQQSRGSGGQGQFSSHPITNASNASPTSSVSRVSTVPSTPVSPNNHPTDGFTSRRSGRSALASDPLMHYINSSVASKQPTRFRGEIASWELPIEEFFIERPIGQGSLGRVYLATWHQTQVAIKVLLMDSSTVNDTSSLLQSDSPTMALLEKEASLMSNLHHPNIVQFLGICTSPAAIVTEYCPRGSLTSVLQAAKSSPECAAELTWSRRVSMAAGAVRGMIYLHSHSPPIMHRDLKSVNVLVTTSWTVKVCDFNLSKILEQDSSQSTAGAMNPRWLAPEVISGAGPTLAGDVFSFGVTLWELLTWELPWGAGNPWAIANAVLAGERPEIPPPARLPGVDSGAWPKLEQYIGLMRKCWQQQPSDRPTFEEIMQELRSIDPQAADA